MDIAHLGLAVDSAPVEKGTRSLGNLTGAAQRAETAVDGFNATTGEVATRMNIASAAVQANSAALQINAKAARFAANNSRQLSFQLIDIGQALATAPTMGIYALQNLGFQVAQIGQLYMGQGGFNQAIKDSARQVGAFATRAGPAVAVAAALGIAFAGLTYEINQTTDVAVGFGDTTLAVFQVLGDYIWSGLQPAINAIAPLFATAWNAVVNGFKIANNFLIAGWGTVFDVIKTGAMSIPDAFIVAGEDAANKFIQSMAWMARETIVIINGLLGSLDTAADKMGMTRPGLRLDMPKAPGRVDLGGDEAAKRLSDSWTDIAERARKRFATDYAGNIFGDIRDQAIENALSGDKDKKKGGKSEAERLAERYGDIVREANQATDAFNRQRDALFMTEEAAAEMRHQSELLNKAQDAGIKLTAAQTAELMGLGSAMAAAEIAYKKTKEALDFAKSTVKGFISDLRSGLEQGKSFWESFGNAALNVLDKITDRLLNQVLDALFQVNKAGTGIGGGGGFLSGMFGKLLGMGGGGGLNYFPPAPTLPIGMFANGTNSAPGGLSWVGERGPELVNLPRGSQVFPAGQSRQMAANSNAPAAANQNMTLRLILPEGFRAEIIEEANGNAVQVVTEYDKKLPDRVQGIQQNPRRR